MTNLDVVKVKLRNSYSVFSDNSELLTDVEWIGKGVNIYSPVAFDIIKGSLVYNCIQWVLTVFHIDKLPNGGIHINTFYPTICMQMLCAYGFYGFKAFIFDEYFVNKRHVFALDGYETYIYYDTYVNERNV